MTITAASADKLRGGYYTPPEVAKWMAQWAIRSGQDRVLEPSCGNGAFLSAVAAKLAGYRTLWANAEPQIVGVELIPIEARKASMAVEQSIIAKHVEVVEGDFFDWLELAEPSTFDAVLGNPPFIRYQNFPEPSRTQAIHFMQTQGLRPNRLTNIWVPFVVASMALLRKGGRLAMVLPAELLQVTYAAQLRQYLADSFRRMTIYACNEMFFPGAEQEVMLLLAEGKLAAPNSHNCCDISLVEADRVDRLLASKPRTARSKKDRKYVQHNTEKWLKYFLNPIEIDFMRSLRVNPAIGELTEHADVDVGVVTGKNEFFVLTWEQVEDHDLADYVVPLVGRSSQLPGTVLRQSDHKQLGKSGNRVFLLHVEASHAHCLPPGLLDFIRAGERHGFHKGYKCSIRNPWYKVPSVWEPDCFFFRQIYDFPRVVVNKAKATSTDTIHRMRCHGPASRVAANLYTHLTAASAEIEGRSYGGGVLELEPTEAERLLVPKHLNGAMSIVEADKLVRKGRLADVLEENDRVVLQGSLGLTAAECGLLKRIWAKMRNRRMARRRR